MPSFAATHHVYAIDLRGYGDSDKPAAEPSSITLPKSIVERLPKTDYFEVSLRGEEILLRPVVIETKGTKLDRIRKKIKALGLTEKDVDAAIRWARTR